MVNEKIKAFAPATVANVSCGFDILGFAIEEPGDEIEIEFKKTPGITIESISGDNGKLPLDPKLNSASVAIQSYINHINYKGGINLNLYKKMPISSGMGSSAASAVAAVFGTNTLLGSPLTKEELLPLPTSALKPSKRISILSVKACREDPTIDNTKSHGELTGPPKEGIFI